MTNEYGEYQWTDASGNVVIPRSQRETIKQEIAVVAERMGLAVAVDDVIGQAAGKSSQFSYENHAD